VLALKVAQVRRGSNPDSESTCGRPGRQADGNLRLDFVKQPPERYIFRNYRGYSSRSHSHSEHALLLHCCTAEVCKYSLDVLKLRSQVLFASTNDQYQSCLIHIDLDVTIALLMRVETDQPLDIK
jgi:hypothetical protein